VARAAATIVVLFTLLITACGSTKSRGTTSPAPAPDPRGPVAQLVARMRVISYYPAHNPWGGMWSVWQPSVIAADMAKIAVLGANTVRIFVQPAVFGYPTPKRVYVSRLGQFLTLAAEHRLRVQVTLFDLWESYGDIADSRRWAARLLAPLHRDPRIAAVELQNEIDPTNPTAMKWARAMLPAVRADAGLPVTLSVTGWNTPSHLGQLIEALGRDRPDFYDLHFYGTPPYMLQTFRTAKRLAGRTPLVIGETGYSTAPSNTSWLGSPETTQRQEQAQAYYVAFAERAAHKVGLPPVGLWNLNDFPALPNVSPVEQHFGLYRLNGTPKPAAFVLHTAFTGRLTGG
jgi:endo-1,4-beta-mannosidase